MTDFHDALADILSKSDHTQLKGFCTALAVAVTTLDSDTGLIDKITEELLELEVPSEKDPQEYWSAVILQAQQYAGRDMGLEEIRRKAKEAGFEKLETATKGVCAWHLAIHQLAVADASVVPPSEKKDLTPPEKIDLLTQQVGAILSMQNAQAAQIPKLARSVAKMDARLDKVDKGRGSSRTTDLVDKEELFWPEEWPLLMDQGSRKWLVRDLREVCPMDTDECRRERDDLLGIVESIKRAQYEEDWHALTHTCGLVLDRLEKTRAKDRAGSRGEVVAQEYLEQEILPQDRKEIREKIDKGLRAKQWRDKRNANKYKEDKAERERDRRGRDTRRAHDRRNGGDRRHADRSRDRRVLGRSADRSKKTDRSPPKYPNGS
eukprot:gene14059-4124_t